nr:type VII secretion protein EccCa [Corynebacterium lactis]
MPPEAPEPQNVPLIRVLMPIVMVVAVIGMVALMFVSGMGRNPMSFLFPLLMVVSMVGMMSTSTGGAKDMSGPRRDYQRHLSSIRRAVAEAAHRQRASVEFFHPEPASLWQLPRLGRAYEREPQDEDFLLLRVGRAVQQPATPLTPPAIPAPEKLDPVSAVALRDVVRAARHVEEVPLAIDAKAFPIIAIAGEGDDGYGLARALILQVAGFHHPSECAIAVVSSGREWDWLKWLPHNENPQFADDSGAGRLRGSSCAEVGRILGSLSPNPEVVVIVVADPPEDLDLENLAEYVDDSEVGATIVLAVGVSDDHVLWSIAVDQGLALTVSGGVVSAETESGREDIASADLVPHPVAEAVARALATAGREGEQQQEADSSADPVLKELGLYPPPETVRYRQRSGASRLRIPVGTDDNGGAVYLDFKESAEGGMGPHGLCIGATGSGKSEFLKSIVVGLAATHGPEQLNFVLVDFKGGATFLGLEKLPHVSAIITNLEDELALVNRMEDALRGEMTRRQELLRAAGNFAGVADYEEARKQGRISAPALPALMIVVDEFSELLTARPEFAELFVAIGRLGRSLHMHLLLASQRLEEGRLRGLESHLSYRVGLKTFSAAESRSVLGVPDAFTLPAIPGIGYLKSASSEPVRFRSAYVSGPIEVFAQGKSMDDSSRRHVAVTAFDAENRPRRALNNTGHTTPEHRVVDEAAPASTIIEAFVASVENVPLRAHRVWLPPLPQRTALVADHDEVLTANIGIVDRPLQQRQDPFVVDLRGTGGHAAIVGAPRSGKTTATRTLVLALASGVSPEHLHFYIIDFGAGGLSDLSRLPHVSALAHRGEDELLRRTVGALRREVALRERLFRNRNWLSADAAREAGNPDIVLVIDGWSAFRNEQPSLADEVQALVTDGLAVGIHVVVTAHRWTELRPSIRDLIGTRIELRQAEAIDSMIDRKAAELVPDSPGRGVAPGGLAMLVAYSDGTSTSEVAEAVTQKYGSSLRAPSLRLLPRRIAVETLPVPAEIPQGAVAVGVEEAGLGSVVFDPNKDRHLLVFGAASSGRTSTLRTLIRQLARHNEGTKFVVVDYRRGLMEDVEPHRLAGYAGSGAVAEPMLAELAARLRQRLPSPDITPAQLKARDWWSGPTITLVVDDYDLVAGARNNPLAPLAEIIPHAADIGLNVVFARRISGALRALHDPVMGTVKDQGASMFVMAGTREDGPIMGVVPTEQPPGRARGSRTAESP